MRIFWPRMSAGVFIGLLDVMILKPLSQYASPVMPLDSSFLNSALPAGPSVTLCSSSLLSNMYGRSNTSNSRAPSGPNLASDGASRCTDPSDSASSSSPSLYSVELG